jgi:hypothetical protein
VRDEPTGLSLDIIDDVLVARVQHHSFRQDLFPIPHQLRIAAATTADYRKVASVALLVRKQQAATRQTGIDWIATGVIAVKFDLNMRRFGRNCDHVLTKRGDQVAQSAAWTGLPVSRVACRRLSAHGSAHGEQKRGDQHQTKNKNQARGESKRDERAKVCR